jgi:hypothetical protein
MFYRLQVGTLDGIVRGYQWREIDQDLFCAVAQGQRPAGDADAQLRDSDYYDANNLNRPMHYLAIWQPGTGWVREITQQQAQAMYVECGFEQAGS